MPNPIVLLGGPADGLVVEMPDKDAWVDVPVLSPEVHLATYRPTGRYIEIDGVPHEIGEYVGELDA